MSFNEFNDTHSLNQNANSLEKSSTTEDHSLLSAVLEERLKFYKEENAKFEEIQKLAGFDETRSLTKEDRKILDDLCKIQETFGVENLSTPSICMSYSEKLKEQNYSEKLKHGIKMYREMNATLYKEIDQLTSELDESKKLVETVFQLPIEQQQVLDKKIALYEADLEKFENKHPWLKDTDLDLIHINNEGKVLANLQEQNESLDKELSVYQGLKPDLEEAKVQLMESKIRLEKLKQKFN